MSAKFAVCLVFAASALTSILGGCHAQPFQNDARPYFRTATLRGSASYVERIALAPGSALNVRLLDLSGAQPRVVSERTVVSQTQPPIDFELEYDPDAIDAGGRYGVVATLTPPEAGGPEWSTPAPMPVVPLRRGDALSLLLARVRGEAAKP